MSRSCLGRVSVLSWSCLCLVSVMSRCCFGDVSVMSRSCLGRVSVLSLSVSVMSRCCFGVVLLVFWLEKSGIKKTPVQWQRLGSNNPPPPFVQTTPRFKQPLPPLCSNNPGIPLSGVQTTPPPRFKQPPPFVQTTLGSLYRGFKQPPPPLFKQPWDPSIGDISFFSHIFSLWIFMR